MDPLGQSPKRGVFMRKPLYTPYPHIADRTATQIKIGRFGAYGRGQRKPGVQPWSIRPTDDPVDQNSQNVCVSVAGKQMWVPVHTAETEWVRLHEMGHVRWSPKKRPRTDYPAAFLEMVEDARINLGISRTGLTWPDLPDRILEHARELLQRDADLAFVQGDRAKVLGVIMRCVGSIGTQFEPMARELMWDFPEPFRGFIDQAMHDVSQGLLEPLARKRKHTAVAPFKVVKNIAEQLWERFKELADESAQPPRTFDPPPMSGSAGEGASAPEPSPTPSPTPSLMKEAKAFIAVQEIRKDADDWDERRSSFVKQIQDVLAKEEGERQREEITLGQRISEKRIEEYTQALLHRKIRWDKSIHSDFVLPGEMHVVHPPRLIVQKNARRKDAIRRRCGDEGTQIVRPDRMGIDGRIFARPGKHHGATVLIDCSGSMHLTIDEVEEIVAAAGRDTLVATYSGSNYKGELRIVAKGAFRVDKSSFRGTYRGNVVDLPALKWLVKQPGPQVWVSDTGVTGMGDAFSSQLRDQCLQIARRHKVLIFETPSDAVAYFREEGRK
jgi:hypothetical protein